MAKKVPEGKELVPPNGRWGWVVVFATVLAGLMISIPLNALGLMFSDIITEFDTTASTASWIPSLTVSMAQFIAPFNTLIIKSYSCRIAMFLGGLSCSVGLILSYFAYNVEVLFITFGVFVGIGLGMTTNASFLVLSEYFRNNRYGTATGFTMASYSAGKLVFSPIIQLMLDEYGFRGVFLIVGGLTLNVFVGAALCQPAKWHYKLVDIVTDIEDPKKGIEDNKTEEKTSIKKNNQLNGNADKNERYVEMQNFTKVELKVGELDVETTTPLLKKRHPQEERMRMELPEINLSSSWDIGCNVESVTPRDIPLPTKSTKSKYTGCVNWCKNGPLKTLDFSQLKEPKFYILLTSGVLGYVSAIYLGVYTPPFAAQAGLDGLAIASLLSFRSGAETVGRLLTPWLKDMLKIRLSFLYCGISIAEGFAVLIMIFTTSYGWMTTVNVFIGLFYGGFSGLGILVMVDCIGDVSKLGAMLGLTQFMQGFFSLGVGPVMGALADYMGSYAACLYFMAATQFLLAILWATYWCLKALNQPNKPKILERICLQMSACTGGSVGGTTVSTVL